MVWNWWWSLEKDDRARLVGCNKNPWRSIDLLANLSFVSVRRDIFIYSQKGDTDRYIQQEYGFGRSTVRCLDGCGATGTLLASTVGVLSIQ